MPYDDAESESEHERENDTDLSLQDENVLNSDLNDSNDAGTSVTAQENDDLSNSNGIESLNDSNGIESFNTEQEIGVDMNLNGAYPIDNSNGASNSSIDRVINGTVTTNSNDAESVDNLLPMATVFLPDVSIDETQSVDIVKEEQAYEMNQTDENILNNILEEESVEEQEVGNDAVELPRNENGNGNNDSLQQQQNENEEKGPNGELFSKDKSVLWIDGEKPLPLPMNATADGLIKHENDSISGSLAYYVKVKIAEQ